MGIPCYDIRLDPTKWSVLLIKEDKYKAYKVKEHNDAAKAKALKDAKAAAANDAAAELLTIDTAAVKTEWEKNIITNSSEEAQLPTFPNPGMFTPVDSWTKKRIIQEQEKYHMDRDNYERCIIIQHAGRKWLEDIYGKNAWFELKANDDKFQPMITIRAIVEHLESKATKNEPVDINAEVKKLTNPCNPTEGMAAFFQGLKIVHTKLKIPKSHKPTPR